MDTGNITFLNTRLCGEKSSELKIHHAELSINVNFRAIITFLATCYITHMTVLLLMCQCKDPTIKITHNIKVLSRVFSCNMCYGLQPFMTALKFPRDQI